tara:strand:- start:89323 stop:90141 length:819 start_codon:yes stop_codon:yes gene_type:complete
MHAYVINLDRSPERLQFVQDQARSYGIEIERVSAVDGRTLSPSQLGELSSPDFEFQPLNISEIALFTSQKLAWKKLVESGHPHAAVFEDDVVLSPTIRATFDAIDHFHDEFDVIKLETTLRRVVCSREGQRIDSGESLQQLLTWHGGAAGYVITAKCAARLLEIKKRVSDPADQVLFNPLSSVSSTLRILQLNPAACIQKDILEKDAADAFGTTLQRDTSAGRLFRHGPIIDIRRMIKKQRESVRRRLLARQSCNVHGAIPFASSSEARCAA